MKVVWSSAILLPPADELICGAPYAHAQAIMALLCADEVAPSSES